jgi:hypothetical protein
VIDDMGSGLDHAAGVAGGTHAAAPATERDQKVVATAGAAGASEAVRQNTAAQIGPEVALNPRGDTVRHGISRRLASRCLLGALVLMPAGFFLGGLFFYGGDPGIGVLLVPPGGLLLFLGVFLTARATRGSVKKRRSTERTPKLGLHAPPDADRAGLPMSRLPAETIVAARDTPQVLARLGRGTISCPDRRHERVDSNG